MTDRELLELALESLEQIKQETFHPAKVFAHNHAINALREALAQPEPEPVAWYDKHGMITHDPFEGVTPLYVAPPQHKEKQEPVAWRAYTITNGYTLHFHYGDAYRVASEIEPLYTAQPRREWVGLTDAERAECWSSSAVQSALNIEAKLKEKNT